jgi:hypothetical protein
MSGVVRIEIISMALSHKNLKPYQGLKLLRYLLRYRKLSPKT